MLRGRDGGRALGERDRACSRGRQRPALCRSGAVRSETGRAPSPGFADCRASARLCDGQCRDRSFEPAGGGRRRPGAAAAQRPRWLGARIARATIRRLRDPARGDRQRQLWPGLAKGHGRRRARRRGSAGAGRLAWTARPLRPRASGDRDRVCRRDRGRSRTADGPSRRSRADGSGSRSRLVRCGSGRRRPGPPGGARLVSMSVLALSGGIGGAKLALGLYRVLPPGALTVVANTGDDFEHLGLSISPDIDTLLYTLAGIDNPEFGWGRRDETWTFMAALEVLGGATWFRLGDGDVATHVERTRRLAMGESLSQITDHFRRRLGISARLLPMSDDRVRTRLRTEEGWLDFQDYFVRLHAAPAVREVAYAGDLQARANPDFLDALADRNLDAVVICPSNPFLSIDPILALPGVRQTLRACRVPVIAVSPIIGGK